MDLPAHSCPKEIRSHGLSDRDNRLPATDAVPASPRLCRSEEMRNRIHTFRLRFQTLFATDQRRLEDALHQAIIQMPHIQIAKPPTTWQRQGLSDLLRVIKAMQALD